MEDALRKMVREALRSQREGVRAVPRGPVLERDVVGTLIDIGIALWKKLGSDGGGGGGGKCKQTITSTVEGGKTTTTITTECSAG